MHQNILVALIHPDEWNQYIPFNGYLEKIKQNYDRVVCVVAENAIALMSEADEYYTIKNEDLKTEKYPMVLDSKSRRNEKFIDKCIARIISDFVGDNLTFISWQRTKYHNGIVYDGMVNMDVYYTSFKYAQEWYKTGKLIYPTKNAYERISAKYSNIFTNKTFVVLTRNYKNKATIHNTDSMIINFRDGIIYLVENGLNIINVGFPPVECNINHENYHEINDSFTEDELISLFYMANGVLLPACSSGFISHYAANVDMFPITMQWGLNINKESFDMIANKTKEVSTIRLDQYFKCLHDPNRADQFDVILSILKNHETTRKLIFSDEKKITYVSYE